jgi:hypothetical protein
MRVGGVMSGGGEIDFGKIEGSSFPNCSGGMIDSGEESVSTAALDESG